MLNWFVKTGGSAHAPDGTAAHFEAFAISHDRCRYAFGHVIWADVVYITRSPIIELAASCFATTSTSITRIMPTIILSLRHTSVTKATLRPISLFRYFWLEGALISYCR